MFILTAKEYYSKILEKPASLDSNEELNYQVSKIKRTKHGKIRLKLPNIQFSSRHGSN